MNSFVGKAKNLPGVRLQFGGSSALRKVSPKIAYLMALTELSGHGAGRGTQVEHGGLPELRQSWELGKSREQEF